MTDDERELYEERAAIIEYEAKLSREIAEKIAFMNWAYKSEENDA